MEILSNDDSQNETEKLGENPVPMSKLEDVSVAWDSTNLTDSSKFERTERKISALRVYYSRFRFDTSDKHKRCGMLDNIISFLQHFSSGAESLLFFSLVLSKQT
jgi:hypothetical protein